jgi:hypothetical protein
MWHISFRYISRYFEHGKGDIPHQEVVLPGRVSRELGRTREN